ncbi:MAG: N-acetylmuramic acid 6-phosphate etherase, partial [Bacteroidetes bacterium]|nr:N-acetylmuramic acid 6-phosphate etherase [Bacteroidota bacterium]
MSNRALFEELKTVATEQRNPRSMEIDRMSARQIAEVINTEDHLV